MAKGKKTGGGSRKGSPNRTTAAKRELAATNLPDDLERELWDKYLRHEDARIAWEAFKLAKQYKSGQPPRAKEDRDKGPQIVIQYKRDPETPSIQMPERPALDVPAREVEPDKPQSKENAQGVFEEPESEAQRRENYRRALCDVSRADKPAPVSHWTR